MWRVFSTGTDARAAAAAATASRRSSGTTPCRAGELANIDLFDPAPFAIAPGDARSLDPQQRIWLEVAWRACEDAGVVIDPARPTAAGVFVALQGDDYRVMRARDGVVDLGGQLGTARSGAAGRLSFACNFVGPSLAIDSDRSSGLVAVELACRALRDGRCEVAIAGASSLSLLDDTTQAFAQAGLLARDGCCKFADARGDGFARSEGAIAVVLKPRARAMRDGDRIYAVIRGEAVRHGGRATDSFTAPSGEAHAAVVREALGRAGVEPAAVAYLEAHGTGTPAGDPVELRALGTAVGIADGRRTACWVGSAKTNFGHTEAVAGLLGLVKVALALHHAAIPASLHFERPPAGLDLAALGLAIPTAAQPWPPGETPRIAGVSSIGLTGTVAHVVVGEAPAVAEPAARPGGALVLPLSGDDADAVTELAGAWIARLRQGGDAAALCRAAAQARGHHHQRAAVAGRTAEELVAQLELVRAGTPGRCAHRGRAAGGRLAFVFSGHGSQWHGMGRQLMAEPAFAAVIEACDAIMRRREGWSVADELRAAPAQSRFADIARMQPILVAFQIALAAVWRAWGFEPDAVVGASMGEVAAACVAGALTLDDALALICARSRLLRTTTGLGRLAVVECTPEDARAAIAGRADVGISGINSARSVLLGGAPEAMAQVIAPFEQRGVFCRYVNIEACSHAPQVEAISHQLAAELASIAPRAGELAMYSTVTGGRIAGDALVADYWRRNLREPVDLAGAVQTLLADDHTTLIEISPHPMAWAALIDNIGDRTAVAVRSLRRDEDELVALADSVAELYVHGRTGHWPSVQGAGPRAHDAPGYAFQRRAFWFASDAAASAPAAASVPAAPGDLAWRDRVRAVVARLVGVRAADVPTDRAYRELGLTSMMVTELRAAIGAQLGQPVTTAVIFDHPTIDALGRWLAAQDPTASPPTASPGLQAAPAPQAAPATAADPDHDAIAIVGLACRFPGGRDLDEFWALLEAGRDAVVEVPPSRWDVDAMFDRDPAAAGKLYSRWAGLIDDADRFDAGFFGIAPREADAMDPQQRWLLEVAWHALEHAGIAPDALAGSPTGVFVGLSPTGDYASLKGWQLDRTVIDAYDSTGNAPSIAAGRLAYVLGLTGPALVVDTACSSSLVAIHLAIASLRRGESALAIAAGVNAILGPDTTIAYCKTRMLSPTGRCRTFDAAADGYVRGEGAGAVVLKRLADARRDGDPIHAVLRGSAVNQDGKTNGLTAPSSAAQQRVIARALADAGITAADVGYLEAHGTGTRLGDPIELAAAGAVLGAGRTAERPLLIGSVKTNVGHLEAAAGLAGLIKVVLAMRHGVVPPHLHLSAINPEIDRRGFAFAVPSRVTAWPATGGRVIAGISSFGFSGTNAHVIVEAAPAGAAALAAPAGVLLAVSARTADGLRALIDRHAAALAALPAGPGAGGVLASYARTAGDGRAHFAHRVAVAGDTADELVAALRAVAAAAPSRGARTGEAPRLAFVLDGAAPVAGSGRGLFDGDPVFRAALERHDADARPALGGSLIEALYRAPDRLAAPGYAAAARRALHGAMIALWRAWGVAPDAVAGDGADPLAAGPAVTVEAARGFDVVIELGAAHATRRALLDAAGALYRAGHALDWAAIHGGAPRRAGLPSYPFARDRHWVKPRAARELPARRSHPWLHDNTSDLTATRFTTRLTGREPWLRDHRVRGAKLLPAAAYLELVRAAADAAGVTGGAIAIRNVAWLRPIAVDDEPRAVHVALRRDGEATAFEVVTGEVAREVHACGAVASTAEDPGTVDLAAVRARLTGRVIGRDACYAALAAGGLDYGPSHQVIDELRLGTGEWLAALRATEPDDPALVLPPGMLDGALQAAFGPALGEGDGRAPLPFALDELVVFDRCPARAWVWVRDVRRSDELARYDLALCDGAGRVFARLRGYATQPASAASAPVAAAEPAWLFRPVWRARAAAGPAPSAARYVLACGLGHRLDELRALAPGVRFLEADVTETEVPDAVEACAQALLRALHARPAGPALIQIVVPLAGDARLLDAVGGLIRAAAVEQPDVLGQLIAIDGRDARAVVAALDADAASPGDAQICHDGDTRRVLGWAALDAAPAAPPWRDGGVYLITGGAGGLGRIFAHDIARAAPGATIVLTGRSPAAAVEPALAGLRAGGAAVEYHAVDVADPAAVDALIAGLRHRYGAVHGVLHAAGVLRDGFARDKRAADLTHVLAPKVRGAHELDRATRGEPLELFAMFSSVMAVVGNTGQADYAVANAYLDGFARRRAEQVRRGERRGRTLSVGWPLWQHGGMQVGAAIQRAFHARLGMVAMATASGLDAFYRSVASGEPHVVVVAGDRARIEAALDTAGRTGAPPVTAPALISPTPASAARPGGGLAAQVVALLKRKLAQLTELTADRIDEDERLASYGMDSLLASELTLDLETSFGSLPKTLLFDHHTLGELRDYLLAHHGPAAERLFASAAPAPELVAPVAVTATPAAAAAGPLDIAIVGISGRYPQAPDLAAYWRNLRDGRDCITEVPPERWDWRRYYTADRDQPGRHYSKWGGFIDEVDRFDPLFFHISPHEAELLEPQERLFLEHAWLAMEDAGYTRAALRGADGTAQVGVYAGVTYGQYQLWFEGDGRADAIRGNPSLVGANYASVANRVSFVLDLHGPSMAVDTMCSSSLTALQLACRDLRLGVTRMAFAGGVNLTLHPNKYLSLSAGQFISSNGHCESFGRGGDGYIPAEGVGVVLLRPLAEAERAGDRIYGVIKGCSVNHGGRTNGYTVPNPKAQRAAIERALHEAAVAPAEISYVEAHGTGTRLGDPIEINALGQAFGDVARQACFVGSAKSNIGHCEAAAGIAGLTKVVLQLQHGQLAPSLHARELNPHIDFAATPFVVNQELRAWPRRGQRARVAGVSSFGAGGANAHLVIEEHLDPRPRVDASGPALIVLSARSEDRLVAYARALAAYVEGDAPAGLALGELAFTLQVGREAMAERLAVVVGSRAELADRLRRFVADGAAAAGIGRGTVARGAAATADVAAGDLDGARTRWLAGAVIDWPRLYPGGTPRKISAPGYPFARDRYWAPVPALAPADDPARAIRLLAKTWRACPLAELGERAGGVAILHTAASAALATAIAARAGRAVLIDADHEPGDPSAAVAGCTAWVDLTGMADAEPGLAGLTALQALIAGRGDDGVRALLISHGLEAVDNPRIALAGAARVGLYRMLQSEYAGVTARHVDLDPGLRDVEPQAAIIARELASAQREVEVCYRGDVRRAAALDDLVLAAGATPAFTAGEAVLITGGTRGLGMLCARHLVARHGVRRLVLAGRDPLPPRDAWAQPQPPAIADKLRAIAALEAMGAEVHVAALALDAPDALRGQLAALAARVGPIVGVLHCAGLTDHANAAFVRKPLADIARVLAPKVTGTPALLAALDPRALRHVVLFSSVAAIVPGLGAGQSDYAMANAFLDYYAEAHAGALPITSVQWPSWRDTGLGEVTTAAYVQTGMRAISDGEGLALLDRVLAARPAVVMPLIVDPARFDARRLLAAPATAAPSPAARRPAAPAISEPTPGAQAVQLVAFLSQVFEAELKLRPGQLDRATPYADYGADSILLAQVLQKIKLRLGVALGPSTLLEYPTLDELVAWLTMQHPDAIAAQFASAPVAATAVVMAPAPAAAAPAAASITAVPLAVVGLACRLPGAPDVDAYWRLLSEGRTAIGPVPEACWGVATGYHAGLIDDVFGFDPARFLISLDDARAMDPQALVVLEECVMAASHAGYPLAELDGSNTGVYIGARGRSHAGGALISDARNPIMAVGQNYLAANVARALNLQGPALVVDTACSSALVALALASDALAAGAIDAALVAGVSLLTSPADHELFARRGLLAAGGSHHIFDRRAAGVVPGEGAGVVLVKRLADAERAGDTVYAVIRGVAINNDGRTAGPATPNLQAQKQVMRAALTRAAVAPADVGYLDVNGSGSEVTDLLELKAIEAVYRPGRAAPLALGSMKPNIGHPLCAEAIASLIKVALMVHHQRVVPFLSGDQPPEHYDLAAAELVLPRRAEPAALRYAALSSFADGGTNGHAILAHHVGARPATRTPIAPPALARVDVRTGEPKAGPGLLAHGFARSPGWSTQLTAAHPILDHHRVYGRRLLPGLAWIDLLYQWFAERDLASDQLALRQLAIYRPLTVTPEAAVELAIEARLDGERWAIEVRDRAAGRDAQPYVTAEMHRVARPAFDERVAVAELEALARRPGGVDFEDLYRGYRAQELVHSGLVKATGRLFASDGSDARWMYLALDEHAAAGATDFVFHPTLIDASAVAAGAATAGLVGDEPRLYLPLYYEAFHARAPIQRACYARIRQGSIERQAELVTVTIEYFDLDGRKLGELARYTTKLVRHAGLINPERAAPAPSIMPVAPAAGAAPAHGVESAGRIGALVAATIARHAGLPAAAITPGLGFYELGLDSPRLLAVVKAIEQALATRLSPTLLFEHTTVGALVAHLEAAHRVAPAPAAPRAARAPGLPSHVPLGATPAAPATPAASAAIAIIGLAGRYPEADSVDELWANLVAGRDCIVEVPEDRWPASRLADVRSPTGRAMSRWGGFVRDADCFDARFFAIAPGEAALLDPQERLFLETSWQAIEDAGYTPASLVAPDRGRRVGVYVGVMHKDYTLVQDAAVARGERFPLTLNYAPIANRVSHVCDFQGPSMAIDTVCASSLTAVHLAVDSLRRGECEVAIAGGVNLSLHPDKYQTYGLLDMHASDGRCRSFGAGGDGYVSAEGVGAVVLKPLARALADGDSVYAVIRASTANHAGRTAGLSVPSPAAQAQLIADCMAQAGVDPASITCVEAHGTGTPLGDLIELKGLIRAFRAGTDRRQFCALGSIKSNIGHAESAAGISSLTKAALQLHHRQLIGLLHADPPNPYLELAGSPFYLQTEHADWRLDPASGVDVRRAGVSAFGATGSNAHVIVEEAPAVAPRAAGQAGVVLVPLSANTDDRLRAYADKLARYLAQHPAIDLAALGYTLQVGRVALEDRAIVAVHDVAELGALMATLARGDDDHRLWRGRLAGLAARPTLLDDPALLRELARRWWAAGAWRKLAELWLAGYGVDWHELYDRAPGRLHLPSYPFARDRHRMASAPAAPTLAPAAPTLAPPRAPGGAAPDAVTYLRRRLAAHLDRPADAIAVDAGFLELGLSSLALVALSQDIARTIDPGFTPGRLFDHATITELAAHLAPRYAAVADQLAAPGRASSSASANPGSNPGPDADVLDALEQLARGALTLDATLALVN